jgi:hypothetical protein
MSIIGDVERANKRIFLQENRQRKKKKKTFANNAASRRRSTRNPQQAIVVSNGAPHRRIAHQCRQHATHSQLTRVARSRAPPTLVFHQPVDCVTPLSQSLHNRKHHRIRPTSTSIA